MSGTLMAVALFATATAYARSDSTWRWDLSAGFDATTHTYNLAVDDTTATISEALVQAALEGRSARGARHRWRLRAEGGLGTELTRQRVDFDYRLLDTTRMDRLRTDATFTARQYHPGSEYEYNSDNNDGRLEVRGSPVMMGNVALELRAFAGWHDYRTPSTLEVDDRDYGGGLFLRSRPTLERSWSLGLRTSHRSYPDSSEIDRDEIGIDLDYDSRGLAGDGISLFHRTRNREVADETVRPPAWSHWTDIRLALPAGSGLVRTELQSETWDYGYENEVWFDSWRMEGFLGYEGGNMLQASWHAGLTGARLDAGDNPDTYSEVGLRGGVDAYSGVVGGTIIVEVGRRTYDDGSVRTEDPADAFTLYSDFTYWKLWLMGQWYMSRTMSLEVLASFEPENHTEQADDSALGFLNLRLVWRP
ncbi:hypothetical protein DRQ50_09860 [bacterium]|nr:MAG: hypothetical protein DRQ50_09860 [bacterium]